MSNECCAKCRYMHRLKHNFKVDEGFEESYCCDALMHLAEENPRAWIQEVTPQYRCEMYEEKDYIADTDKMIESTPNDCETCIHNKGVLECDMYGCKYESTTKTCKTCRNFGSHHGICEICKDNKCWTEKEPTTKNDIRDNRVKNELNRVKNELAVDCISRQAVIDELKSYFHDEYYQRTSIQDCMDCFIEDVLNHLPSVTPQEPIDYKTQYENYLKKSEVVISQLRADRDRLQDAFDKIRAEIKELQTYFHEMLILDEVMQIIDKYKAEIELQESEV